MNIEPKTRRGRPTLYTRSCILAILSLCNETKSNLKQVVEALNSGANGFGIKYVPLLVAMAREGLNIRHLHDVRSLYVIDHSSL